MKNTVATLAAMKKNGEKISQLTCYDYSTAKIIDAAGINMILVGDSLGMTMQGYKDTLPVTVDEMIVYGRSVVRGCKETFVVVDMPFMSYQISVEQAMQNAGRIMKETGASAVKLEGGKEVCPQIPRHHGRRHSGRGAHRHDAPVGQRFRRLHRAGQGRGKCPPCA